MRVEIKTFNVNDTHAVHVKHFADNFWLKIREIRDIKDPQNVSPVQYIQTSNYFKNHLRTL